MHLDKQRPVPERSQMLVNSNVLTLRSNRPSIVRTFYKTHKIICPLSPWHSGIQVHVIWSHLHSRILHALNDVAICRSSQQCSSSIQLQPISLISNSGLASLS